MPTPLVVNCIDSLLPAVTKIINLSLSTGYFPDEWKSAIVDPLLKKPGLDLTFKNYRPVSNRQFVSKLTERAVYEQVHLHTEMDNIYPLLHWKRSNLSTTHCTITSSKAMLFALEPTGMNTVRKITNIS